MWRFPRSCGYPQIIHIFILVGGFNPSEKYDFVSWDDDIPNLWKHIKFHGSKPPNQQRFFHELDHPANGVPPWRWKKNNIVPSRQAAWLRLTSLSSAVGDISGLVVTCRFAKLFWKHGSIPIGSMYGIYAIIWGILMVNVTIYTIHGSYGIGSDLSILMRIIWGFNMF